MNIQTLDQVQTELHKLAQLRNAISRHETKMNDKINQIKSDYEQLTADMVALANQTESDILLFIKSNKKMFARPRSMQLQFGTIGYRTGQSKLSLLNQKFNWKTVGEELSSFIKGKFVKTAVKIDKSGILKDYKHGEISDSLLAQFGLKVTQTDAPFIDLNFDKLQEEK